MKTRPKGAGSIPLEREPADGVARLRLGSYEFKKKGFPASICAIPTISQLP